MSKFQVLTPDLVPRTLTAADVAALGGTADVIVGGSVDASPVGATTPSTGAFTTLAASGASTLAAVAASDYVTLTSLGAALVAAGTTRADALQLAAQSNRIGTAGAGTGVILPPAVVGRHITVFNDGANAAQIYGNGTDTVDGHAAATGTPLTNTKRAIFFCFAAGAYESCQLGAVSA